MTRGKGTLLRTLVLIAIVVAALPGVLSAAQVVPQTAGEYDPLLMSNLYVWKGYQYLADGEYTLAIESFTEAAVLSPTSPEPHFGLARAYRNNSFIDGLLEYMTGIKFLISDFYYQSLFAANLTLILLAAVAISLYLGVFIVIFRNWSATWVSAVLTLSPWLGTRHVKLMLGAALAAFFIMLPGKSAIGVATWAAIAGSALTWRYASPSERRVVIAFAVMLVALVPAIEWTSRIISTHHPSSPFRMAAIADKTVDERFERTLRVSSAQRKYDPLNAFMRGLYYLRIQDHSNAIEFFNMADKLEPHNAAILNNKGVAYHGLGRYTESRVSFEEALKYAPGEAIIHYNYAQTLNQLLHFDVAEEELEIASTLDFNLIRSLISGGTPPTPIAVNLQPGSLWRLASTASERNFKTAYHPVESGTPGIIILIALASGLLGVSYRFRIPARCDICGTHVPESIARRKRKEIACRRCARIMQDNVGDSDELEARLEVHLSRIHWRNTTMKLVLGLLAPGTSYHLCGKRFKGALTGVLVYGLLILALTGGSIVNRLPQFRTGGSLSMIILFIGVYALYAWRSTALVLRHARQE
jgi:tetratricopeptide (TPR) repeat protein